MGIKFSSNDIKPYLGSAEIDKVYLGDDEIYKSELGPLCLVAKQANSTVELIKVGSPNIANTAYSRDGETWTTFTPSTVSGTNTITLTNVGDKVYFKNKITHSNSSSDYCKFVMTGTISAEGNVHSMYIDTEYNELTSIVYEYALTNLFRECVALVKAPEFPVVILSNSDIYNGMFYDCSSLIKAPKLPSTHLHSSCYCLMFSGCTSLITAPKLPATSVPDLGYAYMFRDCTSLSVAPNLPATVLESQSYFCMFKGCTSLINSPALPAIDLVCVSLYSGMFRGCTSLITVPKLPNNYLTSDIYESMFRGCTSLIINDTQTPETPYIFRIPESGVFTNMSTQEQTSMFTDCLGTRSTDKLPGRPGEAYTYYTQNPLIE